MSTTPLCAGYDLGDNQLIDHASVWRRWTDGRLHEPLLQVTWDGTEDTAHIYYGKHKLICTGIHYVSKIPLNATICDWHSSSLYRLSEQNPTHVYHMHILYTITTLPTNIKGNSNDRQAPPVLVLITKYCFAHCVIVQSAYQWWLNLIW